MKKALFVLCLYSAALLLMGSAPITLPNQCSTFRGLNPTSLMAQRPEIEGYVPLAADITLNSRLTQHDRGEFKPSEKDFLEKDKQLLPEQEARTKICWSFERWCVYEHWGCFEPIIPNRCEGEGMGGGGGSAF